MLEAQGGQPFSNLLQGITHALRHIRKTFIFISFSVNVDKFFDSDLSKDEVF